MEGLSHALRWRSTAARLLDTSFSPCRMNHGIGDPAAEENVPRALLVTWRGGPITNHLDIFFFVCGCTVATAGLLGVVFPCSGGSVRARGEPVTALSPPPPVTARGRFVATLPSIHSFVTALGRPVAPLPLRPLAIAGRGGSARALSFLGAPLLLGTGPSRRSARGL